MPNDMLQSFTDEYMNVHVGGKLLGRGGQGAVFRTHDPDVAIKLVTDKDGMPLSDQSQVERYSRCLEYARLLPIPEDLHIAAPVATLRGVAGYVMRLLSDMEPFSSFWTSTRILDEIDSNRIPPWLQSMSEREAKNIVHYCRTGGLRRRLYALYRCSSILARLHGNGFVYGDMSPSNAYLSKASSWPEVWLIDADNVRFDSLPGGRRIYTPRYGAPEVMQGKDGGRPRTDCHSFAVMAFEILTMIHPFIGALVTERDWADDDSDSEDPEDTAYKGLLPWVDDANDDSNATTTGLPRVLVLTEKLRALFEGTFGSGRTTFWRRPTIFHWPEALAEAADVAILCSGCGMSWFANANYHRCPYCSFRAPRQFLFQAYDWVGSHNVLKTPRWKLAREWPEAGAPIQLPERLFKPLSTRTGDRTALTLELNDNNVVISKSPEYELDVRVALCDKYGGRFMEFRSHIQLPASSTQTGLWLQVTGDHPQLISCSSRDASEGES